MILALVMLTQCNQEPLSCTDEFVYGLNITLKDATTSLAITEDVTVTAHDNDYEEELMTYGMNSFYGAGERPGNYIIEVIADGYEAYTSGVIQVDAGECHVIPESLEIVLQPL